VQLRQVALNVPPLASASFALSRPYLVVPLAESFLDRAFSVLLMVFLPTSVVQIDNGIEACEALGSEDPYKPPADVIIGGCVKREGWLVAAAP